MSSSFWAVYRSKRALSDQPSIVGSRLAAFLGIKSDKKDCSIRTVAALFHRLGHGDQQPHGKGVVLKAVEIGVRMG